MKTLNLICRDSSGNEIAHQGFDCADEQRAMRIMIARNRAEMNAGSSHRWGIESPLEPDDSDVVSLAYQEDTSDPMGLGGI